MCDDRVGQSGIAVTERARVFVVPAYVVTGVYLYAYVVADQAENEVVIALEVADVGAMKGHSDAAIVVSPFVGRSQLCTIALCVSYYGVIIDLAA